MKVIVILMIIGDLTIDEGPLEEEDIRIEVECHQIEGVIMTEITLEEEGPLMEMEDPLMMEHPLGMDEIQDIPVEEAHQATRTSWTCETYYSTATPGHSRHKKL